MMGRLLVAVVVVAAIAVGAAAWVRGGAAGWLPGRGEQSVAAVMGTIEQRVVAIGRVEPGTEVTLANKVPGRIKAVLVKEGDMVTVGQPVIRFEDAEYQAQVRMASARVATSEADARRAQRALETARARWAEVKSGARPQEIESARAEVEMARQRWEHLETERLRFKRLYDASLVARSDYDRAETEAALARTRIRTADEHLKLVQAGAKAEAVDAAAAQVREAEAEFKRAETQIAQARADVEHANAVMQATAVQSSLDGKITRKFVEPGEAVDVGMPLLVVGDTRRIIVRAEIDETDVGKVAVGQTAGITADAYPGRVFPGRLYELGQTVGKRKVRPEDPTRMQDMKVLEAKIDVTEGGAELKLGMSVDVKILVSYKERALVIPKRLVPAGVSTATVRVAGQGEPRAIRLGARDDEKVEVTSGLAVGDRVVLTKQIQ